MLQNRGKSQQKIALTLDTTLKAIVLQTISTQRPSFSSWECLLKCVKTFPIWFCVMGFSTDPSALNTWPYLHHNFLGISGRSLGCSSGLDKGQGIWPKFGRGIKWIFENHTKRNQNF